MDITDKDLTEENGIKMIKDLAMFADQKIDDEFAAASWNNLSAGEKMRVKTEHFRIIGTSKHI